ncbi:helix-turn-helix transcriptional regulator [Dyadobacter chenwenxiniae]|uniref:Helix-turn-helix transcriptional regulator n=1 Tax=Dyadobacter chenwenxiniae TaxID=2906456 RepID=A0A9X1TL76_9BACT|nr:helix-turn-helix transcriptional regulator [Dyadobacter chenwenxiniae]MCF0061918.1 helix-turn-helix transcriptional regulator [Dyadobacter chenwenxiniae]UON81732.1 helix-turn-helix transcriptional regulator [Dyadobacter chenwenxiniae]
MTPATLPVRADLFSVFILLGFVQGLILAYFFLSHSGGDKRPNLFLGGLILGMAILLGDVWLGYTNYMFRVLWLVDFSEPINLLLAPLAFLYIKISITQREEKANWLHLLPAIIYFLYMCVLIYPQGNAYKYNCNISAYHPEMEMMVSNRYGSDWMFFLKDRITDLTALSMVMYNLAGLYFLGNAFKKERLSFFTREKSALSWYRNFHLELTALVIIYLIVRLSFPHDLGDHIIAAFIAFIIYATSFTVLRRSLFFQDNNVRSARKYEKSSLTQEIRFTTLKKLDDLMNSEKVFLDPGFSLPMLAKRLGISTHHLSQILNEELGQSFFDFVANYRINEAQKLLRDEGSNFIKIEEIAQMVGYNSKSAFNTSFRKLTGYTPSEFKKNAVK